ncbi:putative beta-fructofuranosidase [Helianthus debilis subsp. tardiflorus]
MYYKGLYHFFCQYNPKGAVWGNIVWAHSVSTDMINWISLKPALVPSKWFDKYGCWSGSATILPGEKPVILYTGVIKEKPEPGYQVQNYAIPANYSDPYLQEWVKPDNNPILKPVQENISSFRDPSTAWYNNGHWKMLIGSRHYSRGIAYLYRSKDFVRWKRARHPFNEKLGTGMWECPDFYPLSSQGQRNGLDASASSTKYVFKVSLDETRNECYMIGEYDLVQDRFHPDNTSGWTAGLRYDYGNFYASKTFFDPIKKRRILWGWANESSTKDEDVAKGWAGIQLIPRMVWLDPSGKQLLQWPIRELETLRGKKKNLKNVKLNKGDIMEIKGITAAQVGLSILVVLMSYIQKEKKNKTYVCLSNIHTITFSDLMIQADVDVTFTFSSFSKVEPYDKNWERFSPQDLCGINGATVQGGLGPFGILALASKNLEEYTPVFFRIFKTHDKNYKVLMCSDATPSSTNPNEYKPSFGGFVDMDLANKTLWLRSLIDHSVVESFGEGGKTIITSRVYPELAVYGDAHLHVFNNGSETITVERLNAWSINAPIMN